MGGRETSGVNTDLEILKRTVVIFAFVFAGAGLLTFAFRKTSWGRNIVVAILSWLVIFILFLFLPYAGWIPFACLILLIAFGIALSIYLMGMILGYTPLRLVSERFLSVFKGAEVKCRGRMGVVVPGELKGRNFARLAACQASEFPF